MNELIEAQKQQIEFLEQIIAEQKETIAKYETAFETALMAMTGHE